MNQVFPTASACCNRWPGGAHPQSTPARPCPLPTSAGAAPAPAPCMLFFGCRNSTGDFYYSQEWEGMEAEGVLVPGGLVTAFSRDQPAKVYVTHRIRERAATLWALLQEQGERGVVGVGGLQRLGSGGGMLRPRAGQPPLTSIWRWAGQRLRSPPSSAVAVQARRCTWRGRPTRCRRRWRRRWRMWRCRRAGSAQRRRRGGCASWRPLDVTRSRPGHRSGLWLRKVATATGSLRQRAQPRSDWNRAAFAMC